VSLNTLIAFAIEALLIFRSECFEIFIYFFETKNWVLFVCLFLALAVVKWLQIISF